MNKHGLATESILKTNNAKGINFVTLICLQLILLFTIKLRAKRKSYQ